VIPIYVDSPLGNEITNVFIKHSEEYDQETWADFGSKNESPFAFKNLTTIRTTEESKALNFKSGPFMVIASSGMCEGGRILHHLEHNVSNPNSVIILTGYQAEHTLGRKLQEGVTPVNIYNRLHPVRAQVITVSEFSAHADQKGLYDYISKIKGLKKVFLVHAESNQATTFAKLLKERMPALQVTIPQAGEGFEV
jgi:metallo-beta-lactamase family protein